MIYPILIVAAGISLYPEIVAVAGFGSNGILMLFCTKALVELSSFEQGFATTNFGQKDERISFISVSSGS